MKNWLLCFLLVSPVCALTVQVDYTYDSNNFFGAGNPQGAAAGAKAKLAMEAAAARWSAIIDQTLLPATAGYGWDWRFGFTHPGTGANWEISTAAHAGVDSLAASGLPNAYDPGFALAADEWRLYVGGRPLTTAGIGGTSTGLNWGNVFTDINSPLNRGFNVRVVAGTFPLPVWGGAISFDSDGTTNWHFDHTVAAGSGTDFYSIALHEIAHVLGLSTSWLDWSVHEAGGAFVGAQALAAYNSDNSTSETSLLLQAGGSHWRDGIYKSKIFPGGSPNYLGTVGAGVLQDLLMEPTANFVFPGKVRFEVTNADVGAAQDLGWSVIDPPGPAPEFTSIARNGAGFTTLTWSSENGATYRVWRSADLDTFTDFGINVPSGGATTTWQDTTSSGVSQRFYQVRKN